jgi:hypothetical protein
MVANIELFFFLNLTLLTACWMPLISGLRKVVGVTKGHFDCLSQTITSNLVSFLFQMSPGVTENTLLGE